MSSFTKKAIVDSFLHLLAKKPPEKITVRDIVDDCGVNRNTFYYYFQDIYAVLEELCNDLVASVPQELPVGEALSILYLKFESFKTEKPRALRNLVVSMGRDGFYRYFSRQTNELISVRLTAVLGQPIPESANMSVRAMSHAFLGITLDELMEERGEEANAVAERIKNTFTQAQEIVLLDFSKRE